MPSREQVRKLVTDAMAACGDDTQAAFARRIGVDKERVHNWREKGAVPRRDALLRILAVSGLDAAAYGISPPTSTEAAPIATREEFDQAVVTLQTKLDEVLLRLDEVIARCVD